MTASNFPAALAATLAYEGGWSDDPRELTAEEARALADAGYMPLAEYVRKYEAQDVSLPEDDDGRS